VGLGEFYVDIFGKGRGGETGCLHFLKASLIRISLMILLVFIRKTACEYFMHRITIVERNLFVPPEPFWNEKGLFETKNSLVRLRITNTEVRTAVKGMKAGRKKPDLLRCFVNSLY